MFNFFFVNLKFLIFNFKKNVVRDIHKWFFCLGYFILFNNKFSKIYIYFKIKKKMVVDPILVDDESNYTLFPIKYDTIYEFGKKAQASIWSTEEIDLSEDLNDFKNKLNENERHYIRSVLAFFAASDGVVLENLVSNFMEDVKIPEAKFAFAVNAFMEAVHSETYSTLIDTLITDVSDKNSAFNAVKDNEAVKKKYEFAKKYMDKSKRSFAERCVAFCCVEGILFWDRSVLCTG